MSLRERVRGRYLVLRDDLARPPLVVRHSRFLARSILRWDEEAEWTIAHLRELVAREGSADAGDRPSTEARARAEVSSGARARARPERARVEPANAGARAGEEEETERVSHSPPRALRGTSVRPVRARSASDAGEAMWPLDRAAGSEGEPAAIRRAKPPFVPLGSSPSPNEIEGEEALRERVFGPLGGARESSGAPSAVSFRAAGAAGSVEEHPSRRDDRPPFESVRRRALETPPTVASEPSDDRRRRAKEELEWRRRGF